MLNASPVVPFENGRPDPLDNELPLQTALRGQLTAATFERFALAGRAVFTLRSRKTGARFTYRVEITDRAKFKNLGEAWFVSVLTGPDNGQDYKYMGYVRRTPTGWELKKQKPAAASSWDALRYVFGALNAQRLDVAFTNLEAWHEGRCGKCARALTVPESIESGIGPVCAGRA